MTTIGMRREWSRPTVRTWIEPAQWIAALRDFTVRNAGRHARLEVDDPLLGVRTRGREDTVLGVAYDLRDARIEILLGDVEGNRDHVRTIGGVTSVDLLTASSGRDLVLRIAHGHGRVQTLLTLLG